MEQNAEELVKIAKKLKFAFNPELREIADRHRPRLSLKHFARQLDFIARHYRYESIPATLRQLLWDAKVFLTILHGRFNMDSDVYDFVKSLDYAYDQLELFTEITRNAVDFLLSGDRRRRYYAVRLDTVGIPIILVLKKSRLYWETFLDKFRPYLLQPRCLVVIHKYITKDGPHMRTWFAHSVFVRNRGKYELVVDEQEVEYHVQAV